ncbi:PREDICTED: uncharacterized protein LOC106323403 [Brassica oleracea var. oleracea]|uniref:uncharacterized protein LOC106323403 n=1 Tax=Brassica oleracea var. oleracea TaxID=109376 RepID=UPI0006A71EDF|nr:PREDICTED: uncharacterized protein LOC106323403 [Brassica oleracea var. oleracea]
MKPNGKSIVSSDYDDKVMFFKDVSLGHHESQLRFRLIHFLEAWNPLKKTLIVLEMLLIDEQGTAIQRFIFPGRIEKYLPEMKNKSVFRVSYHTATVSFSWNSELSVLQDCHTPFDEDSFRFHSYEEFQANCDLKGDIYDVVGHMKLVNGQSIVEASVLDEVEIAKARRLLIHAARDFCKKFKSYEKTPTVLLVTTVNTKTLEGTLALTSMSSSHVFIDYDVQPTIDYFGWLGSNPDIAEQVNAEVCTTTIDDVVHGSAWYYIACSGCHTKVTKGPTSMICTNSKCGKVNVAGAAQYRSKISVYDNSDQAFFVLLGDAGRELTGKPASELVRSYFEANGSQEGNHEAPVPEALISTIGQRHKFCVKVTEDNLLGKTRSLTVTKILPLDTPPATISSEGNHTTAPSEETFKSRMDSAEGSKRTCDSDEIEKAKRHRCGN